MKMLRHYFISDSLDDLERFEEELEEAGVSTPQIHVLSPNDAEVAQHSHLHEVQSFMKSDVIHSTTRGAIVGIVASVLLLVVAHLAGWTQSAAGWVPFIFLAVVVLGFCTWEGGLHGIQKPHHDLARFTDALKSGRHIFFVDLRPDQEPVLERVLKKHPQVESAGTGESAWPLMVRIQEKLGKLGLIRHA